MGRVLKKTSFRTKQGAITSRAKVDTGADWTILDVKAAKALGLDVCTAPDAVMKTAAGRLVGVRMPTRVGIGRYSAVVNVFVPLLVGKDLRLTSQRRRLVGHDFLQKAGVVLDFSKKHRHVLSGAEAAGKATAAERRAIRAYGKCELPRRRK